MLMKKGKAPERFRKMDLKLGNEGIGLPGAVDNKSEKRKKDTVNRLLRGAGLKGGATGPVGNASLFQSTLPTEPFFPKQSAPDTLPGALASRARRVLPGRSPCNPRLRTCLARAEGTVSPLVGWGSEFSEPQRKNSAAKTNLQEES